MNHRERQLAVIRHEVPDRISVDANHLENTAGMAAHIGIEEADVIPRFGLDGRWIGTGYAGDSGETNRDPNRNEWGALANEAYGSSHTYPLAGATDAAHVERHAWPDPARYDYAAAAATAAALSAEYAIRGPQWQPLFCRVCSLAGMETVLTWMVAEPSLFEAAVEAVFERTYDLCQRYVNLCGDHLHILFLGDDFASQCGLLFSPDLWRRYLRPRYAKLFEIGKTAGKFVWFHSCGNITEVLPDLIDIGMDVWETVQLHTLPFSPEVLKREYGRHITFFGAVNTQNLPFSTPAEVSKEVRRCIDALAIGGGYICGPDHVLKADVPPANAIALYETACGYSRQGYTSP